MARQTPLTDEIITEQLAHIRKMSAENDKKHQEQLTIARQQLNAALENPFMRTEFVLQAMIATGVLLGVATGLFKVFFT